MMGGEQFEAEIREQPAVLARLAATQTAVQLDAGIGERDPLFIGSGSSLFVAQLAALAWRRLGRRAGALAATEARFQAAAHRDKCVVALTNDAASPLASRADLTIDVQAGSERAVPASKSVTAMAAVLLWAAAQGVGGDNAAAGELSRAAEGLGVWLNGNALELLDATAQLLEPASSIIVIGSGYGVPVAAEVALKIKEASYRHAESFGAGEFRHGSTAILDASRCMIGIVDASSRAAVGASGIFAPLSWIVGGQVLALSLARRAGINSDTPRGLRKFLG